MIFAGIFATMFPALAIPEARRGELGEVDRGSSFGVTGGLSGLLDNAPTYLIFAKASGLMGTEAVRLDQLLRAIAGAFT